MSTSSESGIAAALGGIVKINSRPLDSSELKRLDKVEKEQINGQGATVKGRITTLTCVTWLMQGAHLNPICQETTVTLDAEIRRCLFHFSSLETYRESKRKGQVFCLDFPR